MPDRVFMMESSIYPIASPEAAASIVWRDASRKVGWASITALVVRRLGRAGLPGPINNQIAQIHKERDRDMGLTTTTNVSVDGVMQGLGGPDEDRRGGFDRGGWAPPLVDTETGDYLDQVYGGAAAFLLGRRTYEIFAGYWPMIDPTTSRIAAGLNSRPKYVASTSLTDPQWAGTSVLTGDLAAAIAALKAQPDGELLVPGSGALVRWLLANHLVDQIDLLIYPVVVGQGTRLFPDSGPDIALELINSRTTSRGIAIQTYRPLVRPEYATSTAKR